MAGQTQAISSTLNLWFGSVINLFVGLVCQIVVWILVTTFNKCWSRPYCDDWWDFLKLIFLSIVSTVKLRLFPNLLVTRVLAIHKLSWLGFLSCFFSFSQSLIWYIKAEWHHYWNIWHIYFNKRICCLYLLCAIMMILYIQLRGLLRQSIEISVIFNKLRGINEQICC